MVRRRVRREWSSCGRRLCVLRRAWQGKCRSSSPNNLTSPSSNNGTPNTPNTPPSGISIISSSGSPNTPSSNPLRILQHTLLRKHPSFQLPERSTPLHPHQLPQAQNQRHDTHPQLPQTIPTSPQPFHHSHSHFCHHNPQPHDCRPDSLQHPLQHMTSRPCLPNSLQQPLKGTTSRPWRPKQPRSQPNCSFHPAQQATPHRSPQSARPPHLRSTSSSSMPSHPGTQRLTSLMSSRRPCKQRPPHSPLYHSNTPPSHTRRPPLSPRPTHTPQIFHAPHLPRFHPPHPHPPLSRKKKLPPCPHHPHGTAPAAPPPLLGGNPSHPHPPAARPHSQPPSNKAKLLTWTWRSTRRTAQQRAVACCSLHRRGGMMAGAGGAAATTRGPSRVRVLSIVMGGAAATMQGLSKTWGLAASMASALSMAVWVLKVQSVQVHRLQVRAATVL